MRSINGSTVAIFLLLFISNFSHAACGTRNNGDGTITVIRTGLQYQSCPVGMRSIGTKKYSGIEMDECEGSSGSTSREAIARYSTGEWRLITPEEAKSILAEIAECQPLNTWTSERNVGFTNRAGSTSFGFGLMNYSGDVSARVVQLVRSNNTSGQSGSNASNQQSSAQVNSSGAKSQQSPPQTYKPGTSALDRYLTAPKEDCDAIPQSLGSDRQFAVSQCRLRNANRDKYAAHANAASAQPATNAQSAQQQSQQAQQAATIRQVRADQARQGKRRRHEPENEASHCLSVDVTSPGFGGFVNSCNFKVAYNFCNYNPKKDSWAEFHTCGKSGNADFVGPGRTSAAHVKNTETVYFFGCKDPAWPVDAEYIPGRGISARCHTVGGN